MKNRQNWMRKGWKLLEEGNSIWKGEWDETNDSGEEYDNKRE